MDLLFSKYASPFLFCDTVIESGSFSDFVYEFLVIENEKQMWDYYLHKVFDKSFDDFKNSVTAVQEKPSKVQLETTVQNSQMMLNNFTPTE